MSARLFAACLNQTRLILSMHEVFNLKLVKVHDYIKERGNFWHHVLRVSEVKFHIAHHRCCCWSKVLAQDHEMGKFPEGSHKETYKRCSTKHVTNAKIDVERDSVTKWRKDPL